MSVEDSHESWHLATMMGINSDALLQCACKNRGFMYIIIIYLAIRQCAA